MTYVYEGKHCIATLDKAGYLHAGMHSVTPGYISLCCVGMIDEGRLYGRVSIFPPDADDESCKGYLDKSGRVFDRSGTYLGHISRRGRIYKAGKRRPIGRVTGARQAGMALLLCPDLMHSTDEGEHLLERRVTIHELLSSRRLIPTDIYPHMMRKRDHNEH